MKVLILCHGSRGDVQPFVALAAAIDRAGHHAILAIPGWALEFAKRYDIETYRLGENSEELARLRRFRNLRNTTRHGWEYASHALRPSGQLLAFVLDEVARAADLRPDLIVHYPMLHGHQLAEKLGVPAVAVHPLPAIVPTSAFANPMFPVAVRRPANLSTYFWTRVFARAIFGPTRRWRRQAVGLGWRFGYANALRRPDGSPVTVLHPFSRYLYPVDPRYPDWVHTTGFWTLPAPNGWIPPDRLSTFLESDKPTIYAGFASRIEDDPGWKGQLVAEAARLAEVRVVVVSGSGRGIQVDEDSNILVCDDVPFDWLFPRVAAVVHHGGVGTTGSALVAGCPQVMCPHIPAQRFVARAMRAHGVACDPLDPRYVSVGQLAESIHRAVTDKAMTRRADLVGERVRREGGVDAAVSLLEREVDAVDVAN